MHQTTTPKKPPVPVAAAYSPRYHFHARIGQITFSYSGDDHDAWKDTIRAALETREPMDQFTIRCREEDYQLNR